MRRSQSDVPIADGAHHCLPLSYGQQGVLLAMARSAPGALNQHCSVPLVPPPDDPSAVRHLLELVQSRNDGFRARLLRQGATIGFDFVDQSHVPPIQLVTDAVADPRAWSSTPFPRGALPLVKSYLREKDGGTWLRLVIDHLTFDAWSNAVLSQEVTALWPWIANGGHSSPPAAPPPPGSFRDYLAAHQYRSPLAVAEYRSFWQAQLAGDTTLALASRRDTGCKRLLFAVPVSISARLPQARKDLKATDFVLFVATMVRALARLSGQTSLLVHTAVADRDRPETGTTIGCLLNFVALRIDTGSSLEDAVRSCRTALVAALRHQRGPFFEVNPRREPTGAVVFAQPRVFGGDPWRPPERPDTGWTLEACPPLSYGDISFAFRPAPWGLAVGFSFETRFLAEEDAHQLATHFLDVLDRGTHRWSTDSTDAGRAR